MSTETPTRRFESIETGGPDTAPDGQQRAKDTSPETGRHVDDPHLDPHVPSFRERVEDLLETVHERIGARPLHLLVFVLALGLLAWLKSASFGTIQAPAVGWAANVEHPSPAATWVEEVFVRPGDRVEKGTPLLTLSGELLERQIAVLDAGIERLHKEAEMSLSRLSQDYLDTQLSLQEQLDEASRARARAKALAERMRRLSEATGSLREKLSSRLDERTARLEELERTELMHETYVATADEASFLARSEEDLVRGIRRRLESRPELIKLSETALAYYEASIRELQEERKGLIEAQKATTVLARASGRVEYVLSPGASAALGMPVAAIVPEEASEIVAYLPARTHPQELPPGSKARITASGCPGESTVTRIGGLVMEAPLSLTTRFSTPLHGLPAYISIPENCRIGVGQTLSVQLRKGSP